MSVYDPKPPFGTVNIYILDPREEPGALAAHAGICAGGGEQSPFLPQPSQPDQLTSARFVFLPPPIIATKMTACREVGDRYGERCRYRFFVSRSREVCRLSRFLSVKLLLAFLVLFPVPASAKILAHIDISQQRLHLYVNGAKRATWPVSTARRGYRTPLGSYRPYWLHRNHYSTIYRGAPMPYSVFFQGGYAIHGTNEVSRLGRPVSHGCIRLHPSNAAVLFNLIGKHGYKATRIKITR